MGRKGIHKFGISGGLILLMLMVSGCLEQSSQPYYLKEYCVDVPVHTLAKVAINQDTVSLFPFNEEWLNQALENDSAHLRHLKTANSARLFTADSQDWMDFLKKHKDDEGFFDLENFYMLKRNPNKEQFFQFYQQWQDLQNSSDLRLSARTDDYILSEPYQAMIGLGETIVPLLIAHMRDGEQTSWAEDQFFLWHAVSFLTGVDLSDQRDSLSEQEMAHKYIAWWDEKKRE